MNSLLFDLLLGLNIFAIIFLIIFAGVYAVVSPLLSHSEQRKQRHRLEIYKVLLVLVIQGKMSHQRAVLNGMNPREEDLERIRAFRDVLLLIRLLAPFKKKLLLCLDMRQKTIEDSSESLQTSEDMSLKQKRMKFTRSFFKWTAKQYGIDLENEKAYIKRWVEESLACPHGEELSLLAWEQLQGAIINGEYDELIERQWADMKQKQERMRQNPILEKEILGNEVFLEYKAHDPAQALRRCQQELNRFFRSSRGDILIDQTTVCDEYKTNLATQKDAETLRAKIIASLKEHQFILQSETFPHTTPKALSLRILIIPSDSPQETHLIVHLSYSLVGKEL